MRTQTQAIENLKADGSTGKIALSCTVGAWRYHLWVDADTLEHTDGTLHRNPVAPWKSGDGDTHRALDATAKCNAQIVGALHNAKRRLVRAMRLKQEAERAAAIAAQQAAEALQRVKDAGPALLEVVEMLLVAADADGWPAGWGLLAANARAAIILAKGKV